jgi:hypothetical protein
LRGFEDGPGGVPTVECVKTVEPEGGLSGGVALEVAGDDASGTSYRSQLLAINSEGEVKFVNPVFWSGTTIGVGDSTGGRLDICG